MLQNDHAALKAAGWLALSVVGTAEADRRTVDVSDALDPPESMVIVLPYAFSTETLETGFGVAYYDPQHFESLDSTYATAYYTQNDSWALAGGLSRLRFGDSRWFMQANGMLRYNTRQRFYGDVGVREGDTPSGGNDSDADDFLEGEGWDSWLEAEFRYVLPIGAGRGNAMHTFVTSDGLLVRGSTHGQWNPFESGRTLLILKPFFQYRTIDVTADNIGDIPSPNPPETGSTVKNETNGLEFFVEYDNRDYAENPQQGSLTRLGIARDFGWLQSSGAWTSVEGEFSKYFSFGDSSFFRQQVLALNAWTAYVPSTKAHLEDGFIVVENAPPSNRGATLGGLTRLRAYPTGRFNSNAAIYYSAELRGIPAWDPLKEWPIIRKFAWRWWQWVVFAELGRVAPEWQFDELHQDMKWSAGIGLRAMIAGGVGRIGVATSNETTQFVIMVGQPF